MELHVRTSTPAFAGPVVKERTYDLTHPDRVLRYAFWQFGEATIEVAVSYTPEEEAALSAIEQAKEDQDDRI